MKVLYSISLQFTVHTYKLPIHTADTSCIDLWLDLMFCDDGEDN